MRNMINENIARLTTPYKDIFTTVYAVKTPEGALLFDAASYDTDAEAYMLPFLKEQGIAEDQLKYIFISHPHSDHAGGLGALKKHFPKAQVVCGSAAIERIQPGIAYQVANDGDVLLGVLQAVAIPGHTRDSMALLDLRTHTLISGDCLQMRGIYGSGKWGANISFPAEHLKAVEKLRGMEIDQLVTAHDYEPLGYRCDDRETVQKALDACEEPLKILSALIAEHPDWTDAQICAHYMDTYQWPTLGEHVVAAVRKAAQDKKEA